MAAKFKPGDAVRFRLGGPPMLVLDTGKLQAVTCVWFNKMGSFEKGVFHEPWLIHVRTSRSAGVNPQSEA